MLDESWPAWDLVRTAHAVGLEFGRLFTGTDLTPTTFAVLLHLADQDGMSQTDLAREVLVRQQSMGALVADLVQRGWVRRDGPGGRGRRAALSITADGRAVLDRMRPAVQAFNAPDALGMTRGRSAELVATLQLVRAAVQERRDDGGS